MAHCFQTCRRTGFEAVDKFLELPGDRGSTRVENIQYLLHGFGVALQPTHLFYCFVGVLAGTLVGVLPAIGPVTAVALLLPTA